jgi:hypothetical protein
MIYKESSKLLYVIREKLKFAFFFFFWLEKVYIVDPLLLPNNCKVSQTFNFCNILRKQSLLRQSLIIRIGFISVQLFSCDLKVAANNRLFAAKSKSPLIVDANIQKHYY